MYGQIGSVKTAAAAPAAESIQGKGGQKTRQKTDNSYTPAYVLDVGADSDAALISGILGTRSAGSVAGSASPATDALRNVVEKLILRQQQNASPYSGNVNILKLSGAMTQSEAAAAISEGGDWGVEAVSDRIVSFAKALAGDDPSKLETLRAAIDKGFAGARKSLGGKLPDISSQTYDAVMSKLDDWAAGAAADTDQNAEQ